MTTAVEQKSSGLGSDAASLKTSLLPSEIHRADREGMFRRISLLLLAATASGKCDISVQKSLGVFVYRARAVVSMLPLFACYSAHYCVCVLCDRNQKLCSPSVGQRDSYRSEDRLEGGLQCRRVSRPRLNSNGL